MDSKPRVLTLNCTPRVLLPVPCAGYVAVFQAESSIAAGSTVDPLAKVEVAPPTNDAVPVPSEGMSVPVGKLLVGSGGLLLKSHRVRVSAETLKVAAARRSRLRVAGFIHLVWLDLVLGWNDERGTLFR